MGNRTSSAVRELHNRVTVVANALRCGTGRDTRRSHLDVRHIRATPTHAGRAVARSSAEAPTNDALECKPEVLGEECIDHRVDGRVAVAQPEDDRKDSGIDTIAAECPDYIHSEEGKPAQDEESHYNGQSLCRLCLHSKPFHLRLNVPLAHLPARLRRVEFVVRVLVHVRHRFDDLQETVALPHAIQLGGLRLCRSRTCVALSVIVASGGRHRVLAIRRREVNSEQVVRDGLGWAAQVLRGRIADRDLDLLVLVVPRVELVVAVRRDGRAYGGGHWGCGAHGRRVAVRAAVTVRRLVEVCTAASVNAQRQSLLFESISDSLGTWSIID